jgi:hypothetical protein
MWISIALIMPATRRRRAQCIKSSGRDISRRTRLISQNKISSEIVEFERHSLWMSRFYHPYLQHVTTTRHAFKACLGFLRDISGAEFTCTISINQAQHAKILPMESKRTITVRAAL